MRGNPPPSAGSYVESSVMREAPLPPNLQTELPDVKILVEMLQNGLADLASQPTPKLSTLLGLRALINEIITTSQNAIPNHPKS